MVEKFPNFEQPKNDYEDIFEDNFEGIEPDLELLHDKSDQMDTFSSERSSLFNKKYESAVKSAFPEDRFHTAEQVRAVMSPEDKERVEEIDKQINETRAELARIELDLLNAVDLDKLSLENVKIEENRGNPESYAYRNSHTFNIPINEIYSMAIHRFTAEAKGPFSSDKGIATYNDRIGIKGERKSGERKGLLRRRGISKFPSLDDSSLSVEVAQDGGELLTNIEEEELEKSHSLNKFLSPDEMVLVYEKLEKLVNKLLDIKKNAKEDS